jgi:hypothetical protein
VGGEGDATSASTAALGTVRTNELVTLPAPASPPPPPPPPSARLRRLGIRSHLSHISIDAHAATELLELRVQVIALDRQHALPIYVDNIPVISIRFVRLPQSELMLVSVDILDGEGIPPLAAGSNPLPIPPGCHSQLCYLQDFFSDSLAMIRADLMPGTARERDIDTHRFRTGHRLLCYMMSHVIIPVAIGTLAGISASM